MIMKDFKPAHFSRGFFNRLTSPEQLEADALALAKRLAGGPTLHT